MATLVSALLPVFLLILLGWLLRRIKFLDEAFWGAAERLTYYILLPCLLVAGLAEATLAGGQLWPMVGAIVAALLIMTAFLVAIRPRLGLEDAAFSSLFQSALRFNSYIGLGAAAGLHGAEGLAAGAVAVGATVPLVNLLSVTALAWLGAGNRPEPRFVLLAILRNPLLLACALGITLNATGLGLPSLLAPVLEILGRGALPLGLLAVGAGLRFTGLHRHGHTLALAAGLRLLVMPLLVATGCWLLGVTGTAATVAVLFAALPTATSAYILARQMGGDAPLMAAIIAAQSALAVITLPLILVLLG